MNVQILGPFNSGTNLIEKIIPHKQIIHKHIICLDEIINVANKENTLIIIMYKNIFNWLYSLKKESYSLKFNKLTDRVHFQDKQYNNVIEVYNTYYRNYIKLITNCHTNIVWVDYYKLINKSNAYSYLKDKLSMHNVNLVGELQFLQILNKPAKNHGNSVQNSDEALHQYNKNKQLVRSFLMRNKSSLIKEIDLNIIKYFEPDNTMS